MTLQFARLGETDGVVESQAKDFVSVLTTLILEKVGLQVIAEREEIAAL